MAISFVNVGTVGSGTGSVAPGIPASVLAGDVLILLNQTSAQFPSGGGTWPPTGWSVFDSSASTSANQITGGLGGAAGSVGFFPAWKIASGSDSAPTVPDSGDHQFAQIIAYRGIDQNYPFDSTTLARLLAGNIGNRVTWTVNDGTFAAASTTLAFPTVTVGIPNCMVLLVAALGLDAASTTTSSGYTNANLTGITERIDQTVATGTGGGFCLAEGTAAAVGSIGASSGTVTSCTKIESVIVLRPAATPTLSSPGATNLTSTTADPQVTLTY